MKRFYIKKKANYSLIYLIGPMNSDIHSKFCERNPLNHLNRVELHRKLKKMHNSIYNFFIFKKTEKIVNKIRE